MIRLSIFLSLLLAMSVLAEEEDVVYEPDALPGSDTIEEEADGDIELDELDINTDHTDEDEDIFIPSEEVSYQQSIPFPTDI